MTYLPLTIQASSDGVANEPGIGGSGCGARTMTPFVCVQLVVAGLVTMIFRV